MNGLPALCTAPVTPFTLTVPQARVVTSDGFSATPDASACPAALGDGSGEEHGQRRHGRHGEKARREEDLGAKYPRL